jgi:hypothetical protein
MPKPPSRSSTHPKGESVLAHVPPGEDTKLNTFGGRVDVLWDPKAEVTALGPLVYFIQFLKTSGLWESWVEDCPLTYTSNNAPPKVGILGGILITLLAGHSGLASWTIETNLYGLRRLWRGSHAKAGSVRHLHPPVGGFLGRTLVLRDTA